ncbi:MAG: hypothetical protein KVP17_003615 [Porospora cf. gigantea B]|uniref:uncharacterized protein n=1 Tax=Porospora cf. gigantea B TaxID=2853592 RepID=UPI003571CB85|nr:MAG: hypothetical protein KVP17_003615 [Porospora cf. gigantea B]
MSGGSSQCTLCPIGTYSEDGVICEACPLMSVTESAGSSSPLDCYCKAGYRLLDDLCVECNEGNLHRDYYCPGHVVRKCPINARIPIGVKAPTTLTQCLCAFGYESHEDGCTVCPAGLFKEAVSTDPCVPCIATMTSDPGTIHSNRCYCPEGTYLDDATFMCLVCPDVAVCPGGFNGYLLDLAAVADPLELPLLIRHMDHAKPIPVQGNYFMWTSDPYSIHMSHSPLRLSELHFKISNTNVIAAANPGVSVADIRSGIEEEYVYELNKLDYFIRFSWHINRQMLDFETYASDATYVVHWVVKECGHSGCLGTQANGCRAGSGGLLCRACATRYYRVGQLLRPNADQQLRLHRVPVR